MGMNRFELHRDVDESKVSGEGIVADGVVFDCGYAVVCWRETTRIETPTVGWYPDIKAVVRIHGHGGKTRLVWLDDDPRDIFHTTTIACQYSGDHPYDSCEISEPGREQVWLGEAEL